MGRNAKFTLVALMLTGCQREPYITREDALVGPDESWCWIGTVSDGNYPKLAERFKPREDGKC